MPNNSCSLPPMLPVGVVQARYHTAAINIPWLILMVMEKKISKYIRPTKAN